MTDKLILELNKFLLSIGSPFKLVYEVKSIGRREVYISTFKEKKTTKTGQEGWVSVSEDKVESYLKSNFRVSFAMWKKDPKATLNKVLESKRKTREKLELMNQKEEKKKSNIKPKIDIRQTVIPIKRNFIPAVTKKTVQKSKEVKNIIPPDDNQDDIASKIEELSKIINQAIIR